MFNYFNNKKIIPFCTHKDVLYLKGEDIKALGIITAEAINTDYEYIQSIDGFKYDGSVENINFMSFKRIDRVDINTEYISKKYSISKNTVRNMIKRLDRLSSCFGNTDYNKIPLISTQYDENGKYYSINHKAYNKYYVLIEVDKLEKLLLLSANALKLYLVIKYNYEYCKSKCKPCIIDMKYLCKSIGLSENSRNRVSPILFSMNNKFIKINQKKTHKLMYDSKGKLINSIRTEYSYEII